MSEGTWAPTLEEVARRAGPFMHTRAEWIRRRVLHVTFRTSGMTRQHLSVDFSVPDGFPAYRVSDSGDAVYFVPLFVLRKWPPLPNLDLRDGSGRPFPLLTSGMNEKADAALLASMAPPGPLRDQLRDQLAAVPRLPPQEADNLINAISTAVLKQLETIPVEDRRKWSETLHLAATLASNQMLWAKVEVPPMSRRLVIKVSFDRALTVDTDLARNILGSLSWAPLRFDQTIWDVHASGSYHIQVEPPHGMEAVYAKLRILTSDEEGPRPLPPTASRLNREYLSKLWWGFRNTIRFRADFVRYNEPDESEQRRPLPGEAFASLTDGRAYLYVSRASERRAVGVIDLATSRRGLRPAAAAFGVATTAFLAAATAIAPTIYAHIDGAVPALLLAPALMTFIVVSPGEHPLVRRHLFGVRLLVAIIALLPVAATLALLSFGGRDPDISGLRWCWGTLTFISLMITILLSVSWLLPPVKTRAPGWREILRGRG